MIRILIEARVCVIAFAPHITQLFQVLVLTLFGVLKRRPSYELTFDDDDATLKCIMKVYQDFTQTKLPSDLWSVFRALGLKLDTRSEPYRLLFDKEKLRGGPGYQELECFDFPGDQLSGRTRVAPFGS
jgi:hypothetical protein